jgi:DNA invertase Pin-like site-specific DNA recombinase
MEVYGYSRVSTQRQAEEGLSLDEQERRVRLHAAEDGWTTNQIYVEEGISGSVPFAQRPQGKALLARLRAGDAVICAKLDRMFRDTLDARDTVAEFEAREIKLFLLDLGSNDVAEPNSLGRVMLTVMAAFAEFERNRIAERIAEGKAQQRINGTFLGGRRPFGANKRAADDLRLVPDAAEQAAIAEIYELHDHGLSLRQIQARLNDRGIAVSRGTVANLLHRRSANRLSEQADPPEPADPKDRGFGQHEEGTSQ